MVLEIELLFHQLGSSLPISLKELLAVGGKGMERLEISILGLQENFQWV